MIEPSVNAVITEDMCYIAREHSCNKYAMYTDETCGPTAVAYAVHQLLAGTCKVIGFVMAAHPTEGGRIENVEYFGMHVYGNSREILYCGRNNTIAGDRSCILEVDQNKELTAARASAKIVYSLLKRFPGLWIFRINVDQSKWS